MEYYAAIKNVWNSFQATTRENQSSEQYAQKWSHVWIKKNIYLC